MDVDGDPCSLTCPGRTSQEAPSLARVYVGGPAPVRLAVSASDNIEHAEDRMPGRG